MTLRVPIVDLWGPDQPSILPWTPFNSEQDAKDLHETIHGLGTQDNKIISILAKRTVSQRKEIASSYETLFQNTLEGDLERSLSGNLKNVVLNSLQYLPEMKAIAIHNALKVAGTLEQVLIQTLAVATNNEIKQIKEAYSRVFNSDLETDVGKKIYGEFKALILVILKAERNESRVVDGARVANDAFMINKLGST
ncbi:unnamed protein product [Rodentolepis nana]|uniref:Annexin n=1 Tax=Rodentolepis nana TaxID=102285 RepID=A0A0R3U0F4_RODNA|nr:unnamed protein product [Rodentolepis nana]